MIHLIIFSKDRACQLDLLLRSIKRNCPDTFITTILYTYSNQDFKLGYANLFLRRKEFGPLFSNKFWFIEERNFQDDIKNLIEEKSFEWVALSTDDTVIYRQMPDFWTWKNKLTPDICTFSLRYGLNTTLQDCFRNLYQPLLNGYQDEGDTISWDFSQYHPNANYGYPFGLDMHIYRRDILWSLIKNMEFNDSNQLESGLFYKKHLCPSLIRSFKESVAVNIPSNNISGVTQAMENNLLELNSKYLEGYEISLEDIMKERIIGSHQDIKYRLVKNV